jgi:hypothetical protein
MKAQRGRRDIAFPCPNLGARWGWLVNATPRPLYPREEPQYTLEKAASLVKKGKQPHYRPGQALMGPGG